MTPEEVIKAGGIASASQSVEAGDRLDAIAFVHPALPGRTVVRLAPERVADGVRTEMALSGFGVSEQHAGVGRVRRRALGFPARALVEDPANARYALAVMKDFAAAKKRIATKPGHARDAFQVIADQLGRAAPHFLPSFWEEAGRAFVAGSAIGMATAAFEKARTAEREHGLTIDQDARADAFLEFALAGALSVKSILAWPAELKKTHGPEVAFERLFDLAVRRTVGGRAPWASLPKDLRDYAKGAKRDPAVEEARYVRTVLGATALRRAPIGFWTAVSASVGAVAADGVVADRLARLFPEVGDDAAAWIGLLDTWGVLARVAEHGIEGGLAAWTGKALAAWDDAPEALHALIVRLIPRLLSEGGEVPVFGDEVWRVRSVATFEALAAAGVRMKCEGNGQFSLNTWVTDPGPHPDPVHLMGHATLGELFEASVIANLDEDDFQAFAVGKVAFREIRRKHLVETLAKAGDGALIAFEEAVSSLESSVPASTRAEFPEESAPSAGVSVVPALARTLRFGVLDELGWPALDAAVDELAGAKGAEVTVHSLAPWAVVTDDRRVRVVGPAGLEASLDLKLPKKARINGFRWSAGQLLVVYMEEGNWQDHKGYWSGKPKEILEIDWNHARDVRTPPREDGVLAGYRILRPGDTVIEHERTWSDREGVWASGDDDVLHAVDLVRGKVGAPDSPAFLAPREGATLQQRETELYPQPVADSPLGGGDVYGWSVFQLDEGVDADAWIARHAPRAVRISGTGKRQNVAIARDGRSVVSTVEPRGILSWPGTDAPRFLVTGGWRSVNLVAQDGTVIADGSEDLWTSGTEHWPDMALWHHLRPRDLAASRALRAVDDALATRLVAAVEGLDEDEEGNATLAARIREILPITDAALAKSVSTIVRHAHDVQARVEEWRGAAAESTGPKDGPLRAAISGISERWGDQDGSVVGVLSAASAFLSGEDVKIGDTDFEWFDWLETWGALVFRAAAPTTTAEERALIEPVLQTLTEGRFARPGIRRWTVQVPRTSGILLWEVEYGEKSVATAWTRTDGGRWIIHNKEDDEDAGVVTLDILGEATPPGTIVAQAPIWVDATRIRTNVAGLPVGDAVYEAIRAESGLTRAESAIVWSGLRQIDRWGNDPCGKEARELLGLKLQEAKAGRDVLCRTAIDKRWRALHAAVMTWDGDPATLPTTTGVAWASVFGKRAEIDPALLARARGDFPGDANEDLVALASVDGEACWQVDADWLYTASGLEGRGADTHFDEDALKRGIAAIAWVYANTPGEDPLRAAARRLYEALRARLANPKLLLPVAESYDKPLAGWFKRFEGTSFEPADIDPEAETRPTGKQRGGIYATEDDGTTNVAVRPCQLTPSDVEEVGRIVKIAEDGDTWRAYLRVGDPGFAALVADTAPGWAQDPRRSAPAVVAEVIAKHGVDEGAATLYLQLLALYNPTRSNVVAWNGWKPAEYARAAAVLTEKALVIEAKRARAGRDHFLPGGWDDRKSGSLPLEEWKLPLYGGDDLPFSSILPLAPFAAVFRAAWDKVKAGKGPRYERGKGA
jgi:hypothetical protein